jgi:hypothetical protein
VAPLDRQHWCLAFGLGMLPLIAMELWKWMRNARERMGRTGSS